jgi:osmoprotectant transport system substrate-binding protein
MRIHRKGAAGAMILALLLLAGACGKSGGSSNKNAGGATTTSTAAKPSFVIASFNFGESDVLAQMYGQALAKAGYTVSYKKQLGTREIVEPALKNKDVDLIPEYLGNALDFLAKDQVAAGDDVATQATKLNTALQANGAIALTPSNATDGDVIAVTLATANRYSLQKISDLATKVPRGTLTMGGPSECETRTTCYKGLTDVYGIKFKSFKALDAGGKTTKTALDNTTVQVARLFSADPDIKTKHYVLLDDDKKIQLAGNIVPAIRADKATDEVKTILNRVSASITTDELIALDTKVYVDLADASVVARDFLNSKSLLS